MAKFDILPGLTFVDRKGWGANSAFPRQGHRVPRNKRTHVIIHHTVVPDVSDSSPSVWESLPEVYRNMRRLQTIRPDLGNDVPYNFVVYLMAKKNGIVICEGRGEDRSGAHTKGHNTEGIGIAFAGNFEDERWPVSKSVGGYICCQHFWDGSDMTPVTQNMERFVR